MLLADIGFRFRIISLHQLIPYLIDKLLIYNHMCIIIKNNGEIQSSIKWYVFF